MTISRMDPRIHGIKGKTELDAIVEKSLRRGP